MTDSDIISTLFCSHQLPSSHTRHSKGRSTWPIRGSHRVCYSKPNLYRRTTKMIRGFFT